MIVSVENNAKIGERKNMNLPGVKVNLPTITEKDERDIVDFALKHNLNFIALSFVQSGEDIRYCRRLLGEKGKHIKIVAKVENQEGLLNYDDILEESDSIMIARGDLGMEIPPEKVFVAQKWMSKKGNLGGKTIITATQMLESMVNNPRPTRAEASDVANAVIDGADAVMLSGETAGGSHPVKAVETMTNICIEAESTLAYKTQFRNMVDLRDKKMTPIEAMSEAAVLLSFELQSPVIICFTEYGVLPTYISKYRPHAFIICVSRHRFLWKGLMTNFGCIPLKVTSFEGDREIVRYAIRESLKHGYCHEGDNLILISGKDTVFSHNKNPEDDHILKTVTASWDDSVI